MPLNKHVLAFNLEASHPLSPLAHLGQIWQLQPPEVLPIRVIFEQQRRKVSCTEVAIAIVGGQLGLERSWWMWHNKSINHLVVYVELTLKTKKPLVPYVGQLLNANWEFCRQYANGFSFGTPAWEGHAVQHHLMLCKRQLVLQSTDAQVAA